MAQPRGGGANGQLPISFFELPNEILVGTSYIHKLSGI